MRKFETCTETDKKTLILNAAQALIQRQGANAMSYQDISDIVGIRKASIHHHFATKDDLINALLERYSNYFLSLVMEIVNSSVSATTRLDRYFALFEATLTEGDGDKACLCAMLGAELASLNSTATEKISLFYYNNEKYLATLLEEGRSKKEFAFVGDSLAMAGLIFATLEGGVLIARAHGGQKYFHVVTQQLMQLLKG